jgi:uncharacterized membrane protein YqhA
MLPRLLAATRFVVLVPVLCIFIATVVLIVYGTVATFAEIAAALSAGVNTKGAKALLLRFIELVDIFLLSTVMYVIAVGLYELFIAEIPGMPEWLVIKDLDALKQKLIGVVIVVLGVLFLGQVISYDGQSNLLIPGGAIALVIAALSYFTSIKGKAKEEQ